MELAWKINDKTLGKLSSKKIAAHKIYFVDSIKASEIQEGESTLEITMNG
jgi:hypothetical protein